MGVVLSNIHTLGRSTNIYKIPMMITLIFLKEPKSGQVNLVAQGYEAGEQQCEGSLSNSRDKVWSKVYFTGALMPLLNIGLPAVFKRAKTRKPLFKRVTSYLTYDYSFKKIFLTSAIEVLTISLRRLVFKS